MPREEMCPSDQRASRPHERHTMSSDWKTTRQRILRQNRLEALLIYFVAALAAVTAILILTLGDSHPGATKFIGGGALTILLQASIASLFPERALRALRALMVSPPRRPGGAGRQRARYAYSPAIKDS